MMTHDEKSVVKEEDPNDSKVVLLAEKEVEDDTGDQDEMQTECVAEESGREEVQVKEEVVDGGGELVEHYDEVKALMLNPRMSDVHVGSEVGRLLLPARGRGDANLRDSKEHG